jgi:hypothetical protein
VSDIRIGRDVYIIYSPDDSGYYLEYRKPGKWQMSKETWLTENDAKEAWKNGEVRWENW